MRRSSGLPSHAPSQYPTTAPATEAAAVITPSQMAMSGCASATATSSGSGGTGKNIASTNELRASSSIAQSLSAKLTTQLERSW